MPKNRTAKMAPFRPKVTGARSARLISPRGTRQPWCVKGFFARDGEKEETTERGWRVRRAHCASSNRPRCRGWRKTHPLHSRTCSRFGPRDERGRRVNPSAFTGLDLQRRGATRGKQSSPPRFSVEHVWYDPVRAAIIAALGFERGRIIPMLARFCNGCP